MMKIVKILLLLAVVAGVSSVSAMSRKKESVRVENFELETIGVGLQGTKVFKIKSYGSSKDKALKQAKRDAVYACIFRGLPPGKDAESTPAICCDDDYNQHRAFFDSFFEENGNYLRYINQVGMPSGSDMLKVSKGYRVALTVQAMYDDLRKYLEQKGIVSSLAGDLLNVQRPVVMVVPSRSFCVANGFMRADGEPDYEKALTDSRLNSVVAELGQIMSQREYPIKDLSATLENLRKEGLTNSFVGVVQDPIDELIAQNARIDLRMELDYAIKKKGYAEYATFTLKGVDVATGDIVSSVSDLRGEPSSAMTGEALLFKAILNQMDTFNDGLMGYFSSYTTLGRPIKLQIAIGEDSMADFNETFFIDGKSGKLSMIIYAWLKNNIMDKDNIKPLLSSSILDYSVRIPLEMKDDFIDETISIDASLFAQMLVDYLAGAPFYLECKVLNKGIAEAQIIIN